jgi:hypothetical protein
MRKLFASCLVFFCAGWCFGEINQTGVNGTTWKTLSPTEHKFYLSGFVQGYALGAAHAGSMALNRFAPEKVLTLPPAEKSDYDKTLAWAPRVMRILQQSIAKSGLETAVSTFYGDYRNMPVCFEDAILFSAASLAGSTPTDKELNAARKQGAEGGCR